VSTSLGRLASVTDPDGFTARTYYYTDGAISQTQTPFQSAVGLGVTRTYDPDGNETSETHHANCTSSNSCTPGVTQRWYDGADRLIEVSQPGNTGTGLPPVWLTRYKYDLSKGGQQQFAGSSFTAHGNLYATQEYTPGWQDISGISYDAVDRPLGKYKFSPGDSNPNAYVETMAYDGSGSAGLLSSVTNAVGERLNYAYDADGKVAAMTSSDNSLAALQYTYDPDGRAAAIASATYGSEARTYDDDGRETSVQEPSGNPHYTASSKIGYAYYPNGMRSTLSTTGRTFTQAPLLQYTYNGLGLLASETADVSNVPKKFSFAYTNAGRKSSETDPFTGLAVPGTSQHIVPTTWSYDPSEYGRVSAVQYPNGSLMQSISYDAEDSLRQWTIPNGSIQWAPINVSQSYSARSELTGQYFSSTSMPVHSGGTISNITFNGGTAPSLGGVRSSIDSRTGVVYYEQQSPPGCKYTPNDTVTNAFDKAGRETLSTTVTHPVDSNCSSLTEQDNKNYDAADHILAANGISGYNYTFGWGPNGHAVTINNNQAGTSTSIHWDGDHPLFESDANGSVNAIFVGDLGAYSSQNAQKYPLVLTAIDRDFSTKDVLEHNASGYGYWTPLSTPYVSNPKFQQFAEEPTQYPSPSFTGQLLYLPYSLQRTDALDVGNGKLEIAGVRSYDPALGSWTTPDAYAGDVHDPMSQKPYMWNRNNPVAYTDPSGYCIEDFCIGESLFGIALLLARQAAIHGAEITDAAAHPGGGGMARPAEHAALDARATVLHATLDPIAREMRATAVVKTAEGPVLVSSSRATLSRAQKAALTAGEVAVYGKDGTHAEINALRQALENGLTPIGAGVAGQPICNGCQAVLNSLGLRTP